MDLPSTPPFAIRARLLTPLDGGQHPPRARRPGRRRRGRPDRVRRRRGPRRRAPARRRHRPAAVGADARAWSTCTPICRSSRTPASASRVDLLTWLDRLTFPTERSWSDATVAERLAPDIFEAFAAAGTTTVLAYGTVYAAAMDAAFRAAEAHGIRAILGKVMMDRGTYDPIIEPSTILERSLQESARPDRALARRRRRAARLRGHAAVRRVLLDRHAARVGRRSPGRPAPGGRPTCPRIRSRSTRSAGCSRTPPTTWTSTTAPAGSARRPSWPTPSTSRSASRPASSRPAPGSRTAPPPTCSSVRASCPSAHRLEAGLTVGLGSDVSGGPDASIFSVMRVGAYAQMARRSLAGDEADRPGAARLAPAGDARRRARAGPGRGHRLARGRQGGGPHRDRPGVRRAAAGRRGRSTRSAS